MRILLVDDDELLARNLVLSLTAQHYAVDVASDGISGWDYSQAATYDLIVLDVNLPLLDGIALCQRLRQSGYRQLILLLTARGSSSDKVMGLDAGADDYVVKPCTVEELCARIRALFRRQQPSATPILEWEQFRLDPRVCEITFQGKLLPLSPKEYSLLELLLRNPYRVFSSNHILENLWGFEETPGEETVRTHIKRLRGKLKRVGAETAIENIYGMGYRLKAPVEASSQAQFVSREEEPSNEEKARIAAIAAWEQLKGLAFERMAILDQTLAALEQGTLSDELREQAEGAAHKLAGSLGMFGFTNGSHLGKAIETWLQQPKLAEVSDLRSRVEQLHQELQHPPGSMPEASTPTADRVAVEEVSFADRPIVETTLLLLANPTFDWVPLLQREATASGMILFQATSIADAKQQMQHTLPTLVILDLTVADGLDDRLVWLEELAVNSPQLPVIGITHQDGFTDRLELTRRNRRASLCNTQVAPQILDAIQEALQGVSVTARVLAVDDDPTVLDILKRQLPQQGIQVETLLDPRQFWDRLDAIAPDLLILDVDLPDINGTELCQIIRTHPTWKRLPILFLTGYRDAEMIQHLFSVGADDYLAKPFTEAELVTRILNRLERHRVLNSVAEIDTLTGLTNRWRSTQEFNRYLSLSCRYRQPMCLSILFIEIRNGSQKDNQNQLLKQAATVLQTLFRSEDVVARWNTNTFVIGLYGIHKPQATGRIKQAIVTLKQAIDPLLVNASLSLTISSGVAEAPTEGIDLQTLYDVAHTVLEQSITSENSSDEDMM